ncbi:MAG: hypothetical protein IJ068_03365 [Bacilli bacterium]|nr:hypothetical protein [Bacilli bacterium]
MFNYLTNNLELIITSFIISIVCIFIYHLITNNRKLHIYINKIKINIQNKDNWKESTNITTDTRGIDLDIGLELYNHKKDYNSIRRIKVVKRHILKYKNIENPYLNLKDNAKTISGSTTYEKLKYINLLPNETKLINVKIILNKEEFTTLKKEPLYIMYKEGLRTRKIKLNKYLRRIK